VSSSVSSSRQRIVSLWLRRITTDRLARQRQSDPRPLVVAGKRGNVEEIVAADACAERLGLRAGLSLAQARAMHPDLVVAAENPAADARLLETMADWCGRYTPLVALDAPDGLLLDIAGCAHLFGGEAALVEDLVARMTGFGFAVRAGLADSIGAAWAVARYAEQGFVAPGQEREALAALPLQALRLDGETVAALRRVGFTCIGDLIEVPRAPLVARFGNDVLRRLDRALGRAREPLMPRLPVAPYAAEQPFAEPILREEDILAVTKRLAQRLAPMLERRGEGLRHIELLLFRTDGEVRRLTAGTSRPIRDAGEVRALFVERIAALADPLDPGFGFDLARLNVLAAEPLPARQAVLDDDAENDDLAPLIDRLSARLGARRVTRLIAQDSHLPELAAIAVPAQARTTDHGWDDFRRFRAAVDLGARPLRLLAKPEPIETIASVPDGPPLRFRWRRVLHEVIAAEGPERIEAAWWREDDGPSRNAARDYFRVEDKTGLRFWVYRAGLYRDVVAGTPPPAWFLHGMFG
jgi:protein ImuB